MAAATFEIRHAAVEDYLGTALAAALGSVACSVGYPIGGPLEEHVWVAGDLEANTAKAVSGGRQRDEVGTVTIKVLVTKTTDRYTDCRDRTLELVALCEGVLLADPTLGGLVALAQVTKVVGQEGIIEERTRQYGAQLTVTYQATVPAA